MMTHPNTRLWISARPAALAVAALAISFPASLMPSARAQNAPSAAANAAPNAAPNAAANAAAKEAVRLRTKWTAGERLDYEMRLDGTMNMQSSPNAGANPLAGIPLDIEVKMSGAAALEALSVDEMGTARVVPRLNALKLRAESFGQRADLLLEGERFSFAFNGQMVGRGQNNERNGAFLSNPPFALEVSERGRITGAVPRDDKGNVKEPNAAPEANGAANAARPTPGLDWARLAQSMIWRAIPTLWPAGAVKTGETWSSEVSVPLPDAQAPNGLAPAQLGRFDFTLRGLEEVAGQRVARVSIKGGVSVDDKTARAIGELAKQEGGQVAPEAVRAAEAARANQAKKSDYEQKLNKASQRVEGDLWVDPETGHVVRAELSLDTQSASQDVPRAGVANPRGKPGNSFFDFSGTLQMQLKNRTLKPGA